MSVNILGENYIIETTTILFLNNNKLKEDIEEINDYLENMIDVDILKKYNMCTIKKNFFKI